MLVFFDDVDAVDLYSLNWDMQYNRNNQTYRMLISICYLVVKGLLQTQSDGTTKLMVFWMSSECAGCTKSSYWSITGKSILRFQPMPH